MLSLLHAGATHALWQRQTRGDVKMRIIKVRCLGRWAMAGCGLLTLGVFALSSGARPAIAADLGDDAYLAEEAAQYHRKSRGSGHTFDVPPDRHPQSVTPGQHRDQDFDHHAYRDGDKVDRYEGGDRYPPSHGSLTPSYGSLKDDVAPNQDAPRWRHQQTPASARLCGSVCWPLGQPAA